MQHICYTNFSENFVIEEAATLIVARPTSFNFKYNNIENSKGSNLLWLHRIMRQNPILRSNIINNTSTSKHGSIEIESSYLVLEGCVFAGNQFHIMASGLEMISVENTIMDFRVRKGIFELLKYTLVAIVLEVNPRPLELLITDTWHCWTLGFPSPTKSPRFLPRIEFDNLTQVNIVFVTLGIIAFCSLTGIIAVLRAKQQNRGIYYLQPLCIGDQYICLSTVCINFYVRLIKSPICGIKGIFCS
jgi:hypothetical protein